LAKLRGLGLFLVVLGAATLTVLVGAALIWRDHILEALLDPELPYAVYKPPPAPDYASSTAWALGPPGYRTKAENVAVFFIHPTTFDGGKNWNGPITDRRAFQALGRWVLPNYAAPFAQAGRIYAPLYRQASLYTSLTLFDDAILARQFPYGDISNAFAAFLRRISPQSPFIIVGVEQGGLLASRLLKDVIGVDPRLRRRLIAAYLIETAVPAEDYTPTSLTPACSNPDQTGCVFAWISSPTLDFIRASRISSRSLVWGRTGNLEGLNGRPILCVNPLLRRASAAEAPPRLNRGAANATGLEWGARPGFMARQVGGQCVDGILRVTRPRSASLRPSGDWTERRKAPAYNLFWADLEADANARTAAWMAASQPTSE
jgi:hypothetical protein